MKLGHVFKSLLVSSLLLVSSRAYAADTPPWTPDEQVLPQLAETVTEDLFSLRPPAGYERVERNGPTGSRLLSWVSALRADQTRGYIMFLIVPIPAGEEKLSLPVQLDKLLKGVENQRAAYNRTDIQTGNVNGTPFARAYWQGIDKRTGVKMAGFYYLARGGGNLIGISSQDLKDNQATDLHLAETSALTVQIK